MVERAVGCFDGDVIEVGGVRVDDFLVDGIGDSGGHLASVAGWFGGWVAVAMSNLTGVGGR